MMFGVVKANDVRRTNKNTWWLLRLLRFHYVERSVKTLQTEQNKYFQTHRLIVSVANC